MGMVEEELQPTELDIDEFIADKWLKGVRYSIGVDAIKKAMEKRETVRMVIASQRDATEGIDAEIKEACNLLLGHSRLESTVRYLGIEVGDALEISEQTEI